MTIEQANQYFAALPDGFASTEQLRAAFTAPGAEGAVRGRGRHGRQDRDGPPAGGHPARTGIHAGLYHAGCRPLSERICIDDAPVDEGLLALTADTLSAAMKPCRRMQRSWPLRPTALAQRAARWPWWNRRMRALRHCPACRCAPSRRSARTV